MANPNIVSVTSILGNTTYLIPSVTTPLVLLTNAESSGTVMKINNITVANVDGTNAVDATVAIYSNGAVAQGSAPSGGIAYAIASTVGVPADASLIVTDKTTSFYLQEGKCISVTSSTASKRVFTVSYELIS